MTNEYNEHIIWLKNELSQITDHFDRRSKLLEVLKNELTRLGYWKNKQRGNAKLGYRHSPVAIHNATLKQQLKQVSTNTYNDYT